MAQPPVPASTGDAATPLFANWSKLDASHPAVERRPTQKLPDMTANDDWSDLSSRLLGVDLAGSNEWYLGGEEDALDLARIIVLPAYHRLLSHAVKSPLLSANRWTVVRGQQGIGKSTLIPVYMRVLMQLKRPFIYSRSVTASQATHYFYWDSLNGSPTPGIINEDSPAFGDKSVTWLMDQTAHGPWQDFLCKCKIVLVASDNLEQYKGFVAAHITSVNIVCMPLPTEDDCRAVAAAHGVTDGAENWLLYGPNLRVVTAAGALAAARQEALLNDALMKSLYLVDVNNPPVVIGGCHVSSAQVFPINADANFDELPRQFGSKYIKDRYVHEWNLRRFDTLISFLKLPACIAGAMKASVFEAYAHDEICKPRPQVTARQLHPLNSYGLIMSGHIYAAGYLSFVAGFDILRQLIVLRFSTVDFTTISKADGSDARGAYIRSKATSMGAVDALVLNPIAGVDADLYQMTVNESHGMNSEELALLIDRVDAFHDSFNWPTTMSNRSTIRLFFVVPEANSAAFTFQKYDKLHLATSKLTSAMVNRIEMNSLGVSF